MANSKKIVGIIVVLIILSMAGLTILQVTLLGSTKTLKEQSFQNNVSNALASVAQSLESYEATITAIEVAGDSLNENNINIFAKVIRTDSYDTSSNRIMIIASDTTICGPDSMTTIRELEVQSFFQNDTIHVNSTDAHNQKMIHLEHEFSDSGQIMFKIDSQSDSLRINFLQKVLVQLWNDSSISIQDRIDIKQLDSIIKASLNQAGIELDYIFSIRTEGIDSLWPQPKQYENELLSSQFSTRLFPLDLLSPKNELLLYFPSGDYFIWRQIGPMLILTSLFMIILIFCFIYIVRTLINQRKNASLMVDFINNMTHEFKTPISTVALASEAIIRPDVISNKEKVTRFSKMILEENSRMRHQAEKILQLATLEEGDFELKLTTLDINKIITDTSKSITLQVENRGGQINWNLEAENHILMADKDHISNIILNLLDNAIKYSPDKPNITVRTKNIGNSICVAIDDKGRGISQEDQKMVFKKYFRVSTGNVHDVKGFGLGLSYVKLMVEAHGGSITLKSKYEHGTSVEILLPLALQNGKLNDD